MKILGPRDDKDFETRGHTFLISETFYVHYLWYLFLRTPYELGTKEMDAQGGSVTCPKTTASVELEISSGRGTPQTS